MTLNVCRQPKLLLGPIPPIIFSQENKRHLTNLDILGVVEEYRKVDHVDGSFRAAGNRGLHLISGCAGYFLKGNLNVVRVEVLEFILVAAPEVAGREGKDDQENRAEADGVTGRMAPGSFCFGAGGRRL